MGLTLPATPLQLTHHPRTMRSLLSLVLLAILATSCLAEGLRDARTGTAPLSLGNSIPSSPAKAGQPASCYFTTGGYVVGAGETQFLCCENMDPQYGSDLTVFANLQSPAGDQFYAWSGVASDD